MPNPRAKAKRLALQLNPPTFYIEYIVLHDDGSSVRVREVKLPTTTRASLSQLTSKVLRSFPSDLDPSTISSNRVASLLRRLFENIHEGSNCQEAGNKPGCSHAALQVPCAHAGALAVALPQCNQQHSNRHAGLCLNSSHEQSAGPAEHGKGSASNQQLASQQNEASPARWSDNSRNSNCCATAAGPCIDATAAAAAAHRARLDLFPEQLDGHCFSCVDSKCAQPNPTSSNGSSEIRCAPATTSPCAPAVAAGATAAHAAFQPAIRIIEGQAAAVADAAGHASSDSDNDGVVVDDNDSCLTFELDSFLGGAGDVDLNKASEYELRLAKSQMDHKFRSNLLQPGDPGYKYDKQAEFAPGVLANEWDDDNE